MLDQVEARWRERLPGQDLFAWLLTQEATLLELLAFGTASALDDMHARESAERPQAAALAEALDVDMADWWQATPATYFDFVSKAQLIEAVTEACGADAAKPMATQKKAKAVSRSSAAGPGAIMSVRHAFCRQRWLINPTQPL